LKGWASSRTPAGQASTQEPHPRQAWASITAVVLARSWEELAVIASSSGIFGVPKSQDACHGT
jgi:hypothetical protein